MIANSWLDRLILVNIGFWRKKTLTFALFNFNFLTMKQKMDQLSQKAMSLIKNPTIDDPSAIARLAPIPAKLKQMQSQLQGIEDEAARIEKMLEAFSQSPNGSSQTSLRMTPLALDRREQMKVRIEIDRSRLGLSGGRLEICEHMASDSLVKFLSWLWETKGNSALGKLSDLRINRGPLVSRNPRVDYWNASKEDEYENQPISNSGFFALTHSSTKEKTAVIRRACQVLDLPTGTVTVEEVSKNGWLKQLACQLQSPNQTKDEQ